MFKVSYYFNTNTGELFQCKQGNSGTIFSIPHLVFGSFE